MVKRAASATPVASALVRQIRQGPVIPIGGAEEREPGGVILERFVALSGGSGANRRHPDRLGRTAGEWRTLHQAVRQDGHGPRRLAACGHA